VEFHQSWCDEPQRIGRTGSTSRLWSDHRPAVVRAGAVTQLSSSPPLGAGVSLTQTRPLSGSKAPDPHMRCPLAPDPLERFGPGRWQRICTGGWRLHPGDCATACPRHCLRFWA